MNLRAAYKARGEGIVLESRLDRAMGAVTDVVTRWGTLKPGDHVVCGEQAARVRQLQHTQTGKPMKTAPPSTPLRLVGLSEVATPGSGKQDLMLA